jgi:thiamine-monophosphate kinase
VDELDYIERFKSFFDTPGMVRVGIGDDAAVLDDGPLDVVTTDMLVEDVHFRRDFCDPEDIGWRAVIASLSDIAAMGGAPGPYVASIALGPDDGSDVVDGMLDGMRSAVDVYVPDEFEVSAIGGDMTSSPGPMVMSITMFGFSPPGGPICRSGAGPGDRLVMFGGSGRAMAGMAILEAEEPDHRRSFPNIMSAYQRPKARSLEGAAVGLEQAVTAMIDVSDGLGVDAGRLADASGVGARIDLPRHPAREELAPVADLLERPLRDWLIGGGEDFELLAACRPDAMERLRAIGDEFDFDVHEVGVVLPEDAGVQVYDESGRIPDDELGSHGWVHFSET